MILHDKTEELGYSFEELTKHSKRKVVCKCDYCDEKYESNKYTILKGRKYIDKDACKKCRYVKRRDVSLVRDGVENSAQRIDVKDKIKQSNLDKFGVEYFTQTQEFKDKSKRTCLKKYGTEFFSQTNEMKNKTKNTNLERYGCENASSNKDVQNKRKRTCLEKYGNEYYAGSEEGKKVLNRAIVDKYGVDNAFQLEEVKERSKETCLKKYGAEYYMQVEENAKEVAKRGVETKIKNGNIKTYDNKTVTQLAKEAGYSKSRFNTLVKKYGFEKALEMNPRQSYLEKLFCDQLDSLKIKYETQKRIGRKYADFLIKNVVVELDGLYWHSDRILDKDYHYKKKELYIEKGYDSLFFREDELNNKMEICLSILKNKLLLNDKIYARKCNFDILKTSEIRDFLNNNHMMGCGSGYAYCLKNFDEIVCVMQIKKYKDGWDISRFCTKLNTSVIGGFSKLLKEFIKREKPKYIRCFVDRRYGDGSHMKKFGFVKKSCDISFKWTNNIDTFHRLKYPSNSGYDEGLYKIWDCGQTNYTLYTGV